MIHQIYFSDYTKKHIYPFCKGYYNNNVNRFFENQVIYDLLVQDAHKESELFGVLSWAFAQKHYTLFRYEPFTLEAVANRVQDADLLSFFPRNKQKNIFTQADTYHKNFTPKFLAVLESAKIDISAVYQNGRFLPHRFYIMENAFIAKSYVWERYKNEIFAPCFKAMKNDAGLQDLLNENANYTNASTKPRLNPQIWEQLGVNYYTYHAFILERLPSLWLSIAKDVNSKHW